MKVNLGLYEAVRKIQQMTRPAQQFANWASRWSELEKRIAEKHESLAGLLVYYGWPPPLHFPASGLDALLPVFEQGRLTECDVAEVFKRYYTADVLDEMLRCWRNRSWLAHRIDLLSEGVDNYRDGRYASCIAVMLPNIEGVLGDHFGRKPNPRADCASIFRSGGLDASAKQFYQRVVLASFKWNDDPLQGLNRHQILHGKDVGYGTQENALKGILLFDAVQDAINDQWGIY